MNAATDIHAPAVNAENPYNPTTGREYTGGNAPLLAVAFADPRWAGFNQWAAAGRMVRKGETATKILMVIERKDDAPAGTVTDEKKRTCRQVPVFNWAQTEPMDADAIAAWGKRVAARAEKKASGKPAKKSKKKAAKK